MSKKSLTDYVMESLNTYLHRTIDEVRPGQWWYTGAYETFNPPATVIEQITNRVDDFIRPRKHPIIEGILWIVSGLRGTPGDTITGEPKRLSQVKRR